VSITVRPVNDAPEAAGDTASTDEDQAVTVAAPGVLGNDSDPDGNPLTAGLASGPSHGTVQLNANGSFTYTPTANYSGPDSFTYRASDGTATSAPATVSITVAPVNDAPVAVADSAATDEDTPVTVTAPGVLGNDTDPDGDTLTAGLASLSSGPSHGSLQLGADGGFTYTPAPGYSGPDSFTYRASDGTAQSAPVTVSITVRPVNDAPVADAGGDQTVEHDADFTLSGAGTDADGDGLTYEWTQVSGPVAVIRDPDSDETVVEGVAGPATLVFRLTVTDPSGASSSDEVTVTVNPK
jgi:VCBS repeat-containing protein